MASISSVPDPSSTDSAWTQLDASRRTSGTPYRLRVEAFSCASFFGIMPWNPAFSSHLVSLSVVSEARVSKLHKQARCVCALSIQRLEGSRPRLRRTRALCKFNGGTERCGGARRLCRSAPYKAPCANNLATAKKYVEERG